MSRMSRARRQEFSENALDSLGAIGRIDEDRARGADAMLRRNSMISRITFGSPQPATMRFARFAPIPVTSRRRPSSRLLLDDIEHGITECTHQLPGVDRPDGAKSRS